MPSKKAGRRSLEETSLSAADIPVKKDISEIADPTHGVTSEPTVKRRKGLGVRVIGGRIYDPVNGKTCHQCRQKTTDHMAQCKSTAGVKPCTQNFCAKCLLNRYGEKTEEVAQLDDWKCPRCRGDCNCSICLKKQGRTPTGILTHTAKATGFTSVADLLKKCPNLKSDNSALSSAALKSWKKGTEQTEVLEDGKGSDHKNKGDKDTNQNISKCKGSQKRKIRNNTVLVDEDKTEIAGKNGLSGLISSDRKKGSKVKGSEKGIDLNVIPKNEGADDFNAEGKLPSKASKETNSVNDLTFESSKISSANDDAKAVKKNKKKHSNDVSGVKAIKTETGIHSNIQTVPLKKELKIKHEFIDGDLKHEKSRKNPSSDTKESRKRKKTGQFEFALAEEAIVPPKGTPLVTVGGMDFPAEAVGAALQLVEFCSAFNSVLELKKGDIEAMLRELTKGRLVRKGANSLLVQFQAKLLSLIAHGSLEMINEVSLSSTGRNSWLNILKHHLAERSSAFIGLPMNKNASSDDLEEEKDSEASVDDESTSITTDEDSHDVKHQSAIFLMSETLKNNLIEIRSAIETGADGYENLGMHQKLQLLIILCDDSLETEYMRDFIESVHHDYCETQKENREEAIAAKKEERNAKQKIKDAEVAKYLASANITGPLAPKQKEALLSTVQAETEKAVAAASLLKEAVSRLKKGRNNAVRTDTIAWAPDGRAFYKLNGVNNLKSVVLQDIGGVDIAEQDRWFIYSEEDETMLSKHLEQRVRLSRMRILAERAHEVSPTRREEEKENQMPEREMLDIS